MSSEFTWIREVFDDIAPPVDPNRIIRTVPLRRWRAWQIGLAAAVGVVLIVGGVYLLFSGSPGEEVADTTTTTSAPPTTTKTVLQIVSLVPLSIECSSELPDFPCSNLIDGDPTTEWQAPNGGIGTVITLQFAESVTIAEVRLTNIPDDTRFMRNGRIREVVATASPSLAVIRPDFVDSNDRPAEFGHRDWVGVTSLEIEVTRGYPGQSVGDLAPFAELALAELEVAGYVGVRPESDPTTATTATLPVPASITGTWSQTNPNLGGLLVQVRDLIWDGEAFYLLLRVGFGDLIVWRSPDGLEWSEYSQVGTSGVTDGPWHLVSAEGRLLIGGRRDLVPTVWIEEGPNLWLEVTVAPSGFISALVHRQGVFVAFGTAPGWDESRPDGPPPAHHAVIWASADAVTWSEVAGVEVFGDGSGAQALMDGGAGLLAVAARGDFPNESTTFVVAMSQDGTGWTIQDTTGLTLSQINATSSGATGYILADGFAGMAFQSSNGTTWSPIFGTLPDAGDGVYLSDVEWFRDQILLGGNVFVDPGGGAFNFSLPAVWVNLGPESWASLGSSEWFAQPGTTYRIVTAPDRLIVIGERGGDDWALFTFVVDAP